MDMDETKDPTARELKDAVIVVIDLYGNLLTDYNASVGGEIWYVIVSSRINRYCTNYNSYY